MAGVTLPGFLVSLSPQSPAKGTQDSVGKGLKTSYEERIPVWFREQDVGPFRADIVVDETVILELLAGRAIDSAHEAKLLNYLRATDKEVGFVMNFGVKATFKRLVFDNSRKLAIPRCGVRGLPRPSAASRPSVA